MRKQARKLENDIDMKLVAYTKVDSSSSASVSIDTAPLLGDHVFDSLSLEIEQLLERVNRTCDTNFIYAQRKRECFSDDDDAFVYHFSFPKSMTNWQRFQLLPIPI